MHAVPIYLTPQSYRVHAAPSTQLLGTPLYLSKFVDKFNYWDKDRATDKWFISRRYRYYSAKHNILYLPRYDLDRFISYLNENRQTYKLIDLPLCEGAAVDIPMKPWFKPNSELQEGAIEFLSSPSNGNVRALAMQTGKGKTASLIKSISNVGRRAMICLNSNLDQWIEAIYNFTELQEEDIYILRGSASIGRLLLNIDQMLFPKIIIASQQSLRNYSQDDPNFIGFPNFDDLCNILNVGVRGTDEVHENFHTNLIMDLRLNPKYTFLLSATLKVSDNWISAIFDQHYGSDIRYGEDKYHKYVDIFIYRYSVGMSVLYQRIYTTPKGYSHIKYETWLLSKKGRATLNSFLHHVLTPAFYAHYYNHAEPGQKCLIICMMTEMCQVVADFVATLAPDKKIAVYTGGAGRELLEQNDIIIATQKGAGTGLDIKNLITVLQTVAQSSESSNKQVLGRLRHIVGAKLHCVFLHNEVIPAHITYMRDREQQLRNLAKVFRVSSL